MVELRLSSGMRCFSRIVSHSTVVSNTPTHPFVDKVKFFGEEGCGAGQTDLVIHYSEERLLSEFLTTSECWLGWRFWIKLALVMQYPNHIPNRATESLAERQRGPVVTPNWQPMKLDNWKRLARSRCVFLQSIQLKKLWWKLLFSSRKVGGFVNLHPVFPHWKFPTIHYGYVIQNSRCCVAWLITRRGQRTITLQFKSDSDIQPTNQIHFLLAEQ